MISLQPRIYLLLHKIFARNVELLTPCYGNGPSGDPEAPNYPEHAGRENLDPTNNFTFTFMKEFFSELAANVTKDSFVHVGMDEVNKHPSI